jgi:4-amino-4-deoxy-L-arabinose transferase-like glycosyltransferase
LSAASLPVIYALSRGLGLSTFGAMAATLAYATSFPFLFYVSRISVEATAVAFAFGSCVCLFKAEDAWSVGRRRAAMFWLAGCGAACGLAVLSKMNQTAILLLLLPLAIVTSRLLGRVIGVCCFAAGIAVIFVATMPVMEWGYFLGTWATPGISPTVDAKQTTSVMMIGQKLWSVFADLGGSLGKLSLRPQIGFNGMFNLLESTFVIVGIAAGVAYVRRRGWSRRHLLVVAFVLWTVFLWWYRGTTVFLLSFHYLFFFMALLAVWFGDAVDRIVTRLDVDLPRARAGWLAIAVILVHGQSVWGFIDTRMSDVKYYRGFSKPLFELQAQLKPGARAAILTTSAEQPHVQSFYGLDFSYVVGKPSNIQAALPMDAIAVTGLEPAAIEERLQAYQYVVDLTAGEAKLPDGSVTLQTVADWVAAHRNVAPGDPSTLKEK